MPMGYIFDGFYNVPLPQARRLRIVHTVYSSFAPVQTDICSLNRIRCKGAPVILIAPKAFIVEYG